MMSAVWRNQNRDSPVSTRPLSGIGVGRTTSNADSRSLATSSRRSPTSNRSRTLPERTNPLEAWSAGPPTRGSPGLPASTFLSAGDIGGLLSSRNEVIQSGHGGGHVAQEVAFVKTGSEVFV